MQRACLSALLLLLFLASLFGSGLGAQLTIGGRLAQQICDMFVAHSGTDSSSCGNVTSPCATIQQAVLNAREGYTVCVRAGDTPYACPEGGQGTLIHSTLNLVAVDGVAVIDCMGKGRALRYIGGNDSTDAVGGLLTGFDIRGGYLNGSSGGGAVSINGTSSMLISNCTFIGNGKATPRIHGGEGGAIYSLRNTNLRIEDCTFISNYAVNIAPNYAYSDGGAIASDFDTNLRIQGCVFNNNTAVNGGALSLRNGRRTTISSCRFYNNSAPENTPTQVGIGGAISSQFAEGVTITGCVFSNSSAPMAAAIYSTQSTAVRITSTLFTSHTTSAIAHSFDSNVTLWNNTFTSNPGGGLQVGAMLNCNISNCTFINNNGKGAVLLQAGENITIEKCVFIANIGSQGGAISSSNTANTAISECRFENNSALGHGGALAFNIDSPTFITNCTFVNNTASTGAYGGAICFMSSNRLNGLVIRGSTFTSNTGESGGAIGCDINNMLTVQHCTFTNNTSSFVGGAVAITNLFATNYSNTNITTSFEDCTFTNNIGWLGGGVAIAYPRGQNGASNSYSFTNSVFQGNQATTGGGGGVYLVYPPDEPLPSSNPNQQGQPRQWRYKQNWAYFNGITFANNSATCFSCTGGGLYLDSGQSVISECDFHDNSVGFFGGAIAIGGSSTQVSLISSTFRNNNATADGIDFYSNAGGTLNISNCNVEAEASELSFFEVPQGGQVLIFGSNVTCAAGSQFINGSLPPYPVDMAPWGYVMVTTASLTCLPCHSGTYSLTGGSSVGGSTNVVVCHECPGQADCSHGGADVLALPGYWCHPTAWDNSELECQVCPEGFCADEPGPWNESCIGNRDGILCGDCEPGYSEAFGTEECVPNAECSTSAWFLPAVFAVGILYVLLVVWFPVNHNPLWKSIVYFMQTVPLVTTLDGSILRTTFAIFSLGVSLVGISLRACPWRELDMVEKISSDYLLPVLLLLELGMMLGVHYLIIRLRRHSSESSQEDCHGDIIEYIKVEEEEPEKHGDDEEDEEEGGEEEHEHGHPHSPFVRYTAALAGLILFMYEGVTSATMELLNCVPVNDQLRLFVAGMEKCYATWQYPLLVLLVLVLLPFPFVLVLIRYCISKRCGHNPHGHAVLEVLEHPYAPKRKWWETMGMLRRLILLTLAIFILDPIWKSLALFLGCFLVLASHVYLQPFANKRQHGTVETVFLFDLTLLSALSIPHAVYADLGEVLEGATADAIEYIEAILTLLPLAYCLFVLVRMYAPPLLRWILLLCPEGWLNRCSSLLPQRGPHYYWLRVRRSGSASLNGDASFDTVILDEEEHEDIHTEPETHTENPSTN